MSFTEFHWMGGVLFMSVLSICLTIIIAATILNIIRIANGNYQAGKQFLTIQDIKAIGIFAIIWGIFGQSIGLFSALQAIEAAADVSPAMIFGGLKVSFITTLYGTFIFLLAWLITILMNNWSRRLT
jgi:biopolymer transport protein ExbB/TolQ